jgi:hypothetical protein
MVLGPEDLVTCGAEKGQEISLEARGRGAAWFLLVIGEVFPAAHHSGSKPWMLGWLQQRGRGRRVLGSRVGLGSAPQGSSRLSR